MNNAYLKSIEQQLAETRFGFERIRDVYDRTEKYLASPEQNEARGRVLVVLINSFAGSNKDETYKSGRFLYAEKPVNGETILDFNKAENPPCAFTPYATCPLPPPGNKLDAEIAAGEKRYDH